MFVPGEFRKLVGIQATEFDGQFFVDCSLAYEISFRDECSPMKVYVLNPELICPGVQIHQRACYDEIMQGVALDRHHRHEQAASPEEADMILAPIQSDGLGLNYRVLKASDFTSGTSRRSLPTLRLISLIRRSRAFTWRRPRIGPRGDGSAGRTTFRRTSAATTSSSLFPPSAKTCFSHSWVLRTRTLSGRMSCV